MGELAHTQGVVRFQYIELFTFNIKSRTLPLNLEPSEPLISFLILKRFGSRKLGTTHIHSPSFGGIKFCVYDETILHGISPRREATKGKDRLTAMGRGSRIHITDFYVRELTAITDRIGDRPGAFCYLRICTRDSSVHLP
jgi:hypothetical protein